MNIGKTEFHDWIEKYLDGKLTEEENTRFRELLLTDPELAEQYQIRIKLAENWTKAKEYGNTRQSIAATIREAKSEKKNRLFVWSIAASFLILISVSGVVMFSNLNSDQAPIAKNSNKAESHAVPQIKQAEEKASLHIMGQLKLISPVKNKLYKQNDSIVFAWKSEIDAESNLTIENQKNGKMIYREKIKLNALKFVLGKNFLPEGEYQWFIEGFPGKEKFRVITSEN